MESTDNINTDVISPGVSLDFGVDLTDGTANEHADENNIEQNVVCAAVVKHKFKRHVVTKASLMKAIYKLNGRILFLERNLQYYKNWLFEMEKECDCCEEYINIVDETYACTECCKFICDICVFRSKKHKKCERVLHYYDLVNYHVQNSDDENEGSDEGSDENTDNEKDEENDDEEHQDE